MSAALQEVREFSQFVEEELRRGEGSRPLEDYLRLWREAHERASTLQAIQEGMDDVQSGRTRPAAEVLAEIRREIGAA